MSTSGRIMETSNRLKGLICRDLPKRIVRFAFDYFRLNSAPLIHFSGPHIPGKTMSACRHAAGWVVYFFSAAKGREGRRRKIKKNHHHVSIRQCDGKPIHPVFSHIGPPHRGVDKIGEID